MQTPSRHQNPFATCWTNPDVVSYVAGHSDSLEQLARQLSEQNWRGEIVGPHGVGKSTLLHAIEPHVVAGGKEWLRIDVHDQGDRDAWQKIRELKLDDAPLLVIDGYEQLTRLHRWRVGWRCHRAGAGLLVTAHEQTGLPLLAELSPSLDIALEVFHKLTADRPTPIHDEDVRRVFNACDGNIRELFFNLYDLHERHS